MLRLVIIALLGVLLFHVLKIPMEDGQKVAACCGIGLAMMMVWTVKR